MADDDAGLISADLIAQHRHYGRCLTVVRIHETEGQHGVDVLARHSPVREGRVTV